MANDISKLIQLEHNCKSCDDELQLYHVIVNQTRSIIEYEQAVLFESNLNNKLKTVAISDVAAVDTTSPFVQFVDELSNSLDDNKNDILFKNKNELSDFLIEEISQYSPDNMAYIPINIIKNGVELKYSLLMFRNKSFTEKELELLKYAQNSFSYFLFSVRKCSFFSKLKKLNIKKQHFILILLAMVLIMFLPVRMNILAPFEIQAKDPTIITSPINGVIKSILVKSNEKVSKGDLLVKIDDIDFVNKYEITKRELETVKAEFYTIKQASFYEHDKKAQLKKFQTQVELKKAQLEFVKKQLEKTSIYSNRNGIVIINNPKEWEGKPVSTGEKILLVSKPSNVEIKIMVPVSDALFLKEEADVKVFLDNKIFESWNAKISSISYIPELSAERVLSYKVIAQFDDINNIPKIGLRGTAKLYSNEVTLFFYLFRKPITYLRQLIAW